jgi:hypothetical protein
MSGPGIIPPDGCGADKDHDGDVDLVDWMQQQICGPGFTEQMNVTPVGS